MLGGRKELETACEVTRGQIFRRLQNCHYKCVQKTMMNHDSKSKERYTDNVTPIKIINREKSFKKNKLEILELKVQ